MGGNTNSQRRPHSSNNYNDYFYNNNNMQRNASLFSPVHFNTHLSPKPKVYTDKEILSLRDPTLISWPNIFLGSNYGNKNPQLLKQLGITHVLNMAFEIKGHPELVNDKNIKYKHVAADDSHRYNIRQHFEECFAFMDDAIASNGKVYVHCMMGISRSSTIVIGYLMSRYNMSLNAAYNFAKSRRPEVSPNSSFMRYLEKYGEELKQKKEAGGIENTNANTNNLANRGHYASNFNLNNYQGTNNYNTLNESNKRHLKYRTSVSPINNNISASNPNLNLNDINKSIFYDNSHMNNTFNNESQVASPYSPAGYGFDNNINASKLNKPNIYGYDSLKSANHSLFGYDNNIAVNGMQHGFDNNFPYY